MIIVSVPGVHAYGKTKGSEKMPKQIVDYIRCEKDCKKLKFVEFNLDTSDLAFNQKNIFIESMKLFRENRYNNEKILFLGGDHSISFPLFNAFRQVFQNPFLFDLDAHFDMMPPLKEVSHEEWLQALLNEGFDSANLRLIGARKIYPEEEENFKRSNIKVIKISEFDDFLKNKENFNLQENDSIYLSLDLDVLDEKLFSATGYPVAGGLTEEQLKKFLDKLFSLKNFKAMDLVEFNPEKDQEDRKGLKIVMNIINQIIKNEI
jgi:arginase family enzyme